MCLKLSAALISLALFLGCASEFDRTIDRLQQGTPKQRSQAAAFLGAQRIAEAAPHLREALEDTTAEVRAKSAWALGMLRSKTALPDLLRLLDDEKRSVRQAAAVALMQVEEPDAIPVLKRALDIESDIWVKRDMSRAVQFLEQFVGEEDVGEGRVRGAFY